MFYKSIKLWVLLKRLFLIWLFLSTEGIIILSLRGATRRWLGRTIKIKEIYCDNFSVDAFSLQRLVAANLIQLIVLHNLSPANLLRVHFIVQLISLMKVLQNSDPSPDPRGTAIITDLHLNIKPLTTMILRPVLHPSNPSLSSLKEGCYGDLCQRPCWSPDGWSVALPLSTHAVMAS